MRRVIIVLILIMVLLWMSSVASAQTPSTSVVIISPMAGEVLQGVVMVTGSNMVDGFMSAEISFAYAEDVTGTWFRLAQSQQPVTGGTLAIWDTSVVTDGNYNLRLHVDLIDGALSEVIVQDLQVRNYTPTEVPATSTPLLILPLTNTPVLPILAPISVPSATSHPTPTALPTNPAILSPKDILRSVLYGGLIVMTLFIFLVLYLRLRRK